MIVTAISTRRKRCRIRSHFCRIQLRTNNCRSIEKAIVVIVIISRQGVEDKLRRIRIVFWINLQFWLSAHLRMARSYLALKTKPQGSNRTQLATTPPECFNSKRATQNQLRKATRPSPPSQSSHPRWWSASTNNQAACCNQNLTCQPTRSRHSRSSRRSSRKIKLISTRRAAFCRSSKEESTRHVCPSPRGMPSRIRAIVQSRWCRLIVQVAIDHHTNQRRSVPVTLITTVLWRSRV